jgi:competence protein ComK
MEHGRLLIEEYEINSSTVVLLPLTYGSKVFTKIYEMEDESISPFKPIDIIKESCFNFGSNYEGRKAATRKLIGAIHKVPIAISPLIYLFPTTSPENPLCIWVAHEHVIDYKKGEDGSTTIVKFRNNRCIPIPISASSFENQLIRTMMLKTKLSRNGNEALPRSIYTSKLRKQKSAEDSGEYDW